MERSKVIFGNEMSERVYKKAVKQKAKMVKKFGDDSQASYNLGVMNNKTIGPFLGVKNLVLHERGYGLEDEKGIIIGNIRMGFGHYRISMAIASAAHAMGYTPYWMDLHAYQETVGGKVIKHLNELYSTGSRLSQKSKLFNRFYWEPLNSEGFKKLSYNAADQKVAELMTPIFQTVPKYMPFIATHVWPAQAAIHAGMNHVINVIPDNWPMALHLAEGSIHTVQTPSSFLGYKTLKGMNGNQVLNPMPEGQLYDTGHYIDHELVSNLESDTAKRLTRIEKKQAKRILMTVGGAGAQKELYANLIEHLMPRIKKEEVVLYVNVGDHLKVWNELCEAVPTLRDMAKFYENDFDQTVEFANKALDEYVMGIHAFCDTDIFAAVYSTNLLMRSCDICVTKPSELAFYPVPKLLVKRVGGHEAYGALRAAEIGDGTVECETTELSLQMIDLMLNDDSILTSFNENILKAHAIGVYDGAYKVIELAVKG